jgi:zinc transport system substrate-binding protein
MRKWVAGLVLLLAAPLSACTPPGDDGAVDVVASFYPLQYVAEQIVGDHAEVTNLTSPGAEPHDLELSPRQVARLTTAEVVLYQSGFQPAVDAALENDRPDHVVDAAEVVGLHREEAHEDSGDDGHDHQGGDPHFWLDPTLLASAAEAFTGAMGEAVPEHAADFRDANDRLQDELTTLDEEFRTRLDDCETRTLVVSHDAFGYLGEAYDLDVQSIAGLTPDAEPSARHLAELADLVREDGVTTVFSEQLASPRLAESLADDVGVRTAVLDPLEGLASADSRDDYPSLMRANLRAIREAGRCR